MKKRQPGDIEIFHYYSSSAGAFVTSCKTLQDKAIYRVTETVSGGAVLRPLQPRDDDLASIRFAHEIFTVLVRQKKRKDETVRACLERIIVESPDADR